MESLKAVLTEEGLVSFECKVVGFPTPLLRWFKDGQELKPGDVYQLTGTNSLGIRNELTFCNNFWVLNLRNRFYCVGIVYDCIPNQVRTVALRETAWVRLEVLQNSPLKISRTNSTKKRDFNF